jgi:hypothetical protein
MKPNLIHYYFIFAFHRLYLLVVSIALIISLITVAWYTARHCELTSVSYSSKTYTLSTNKGSNQSGVDSSFFYQSSSAAVRGIPLY